MASFFSYIFSCKRRFSLALGNLIPPLRMRSPLLRAMCFLLMAFTYALFLEEPAFTFWRMSSPNWNFVTTLFLTNAIFAFAPLPPKKRILIGTVLGIAALGSMSNAGISLFLFLLPSASLVLFRSTGSGKFRVILTAAFVAALYWLRFRPNADLLTVFIVSFWLKLVSLALTDRARLPRGLEGHIRTAFYFFAPPFLLGPVPLEWIRFSYFEARSSETSLNDTRALKMLTHGTAFLLLANYPWARLSEAISLIFPVFSETTPWWQQAAWGYSLFISRYLTIGGFTALSLGIFQLARIELKYDFHFPFLARDFLDFWSRYHSYAKDFLYAHVYLPFYFNLPPLFSHFARVALGLVAVFSMVAFVQHMNYVPTNFANTTDYYSLRASFQHAAASLTFLLWTVLMHMAIRRATGPWTHAAELLCWAQTQLAIGYFFFGAYWNLWKGLPLDLYFLRIFGG